MKRLIRNEKIFFILRKQEATAVQEKSSKNNVMRDLHIRKLCLNICVGESGDRLTRAAKVIEKQIEMIFASKLFHLLLYIIIRYSGFRATDWSTAGIFKSTLYRSLFRHSS